MDISVCTTVYNEANSVREFLASLLAQSLPPGEIVVVDGGSTDGTYDVLRAFADQHACIRLIHDPTCNRQHMASPIAHGRNAAIGEAHGEIIAVTDAGCRLDPHWLEEIVRPFREDPSVEVVGGWYEPWIETPFERCAASVSFTVTKEALARHMFPSSRSVAFRKSLWERVGGYPEVTYVAEDSLFNERWKQAGARFVFTDRAVVYWKPRGTFAALCRQFFRYSQADALSGIHGSLHLRWASKYLMFLVLVVMGFVWHWLGLVAAAALMLSYGFYLWLKRADKQLLFCPVVLKIIIDATRVAGYITGKITSLFGRAHTLSL
jgi:glycosyltransferase involved in cell wall biosynthesis